MTRKCHFIICTSVGLQKDLDEMKIKCRDSYKVAKDNIDGESTSFILLKPKALPLTAFKLVDMFSGLKKQLDGLFAQVSASKSPAEDGRWKMIHIEALDFNVFSFVT